MRDPLPEGTSEIQLIDESPSDRLDSWKEIAAYFRRDVRTVRRWEHSLGLPVHRHRQRRGVAVYAYKSEVDEWWRLRDQTSEASAPPPAARSLRPGPLVWAAIASLTTLGILLGVWRDGSSTAPPDSPVPVTSYPGIEESPSLSPDGNRLVFSWNGEDGRNFDIYMKSLDTSLADPVRLTTDAAPDTCPVWSPDGRSIAFVRQAEPGELKVLLIPSVGGAEREVATARVTWEREVGSYLAWTPDGKGLVFLDRESPDQPVGLFLISLENAVSRRLTTPPGGWWGDSSPAFSPDGRLLAFERLSTLAVSDIYLLPVSGDWSAVAQPRRLTTSEYGATNPAWANNGRDILFVASKGAEARIRRVSASGSGHAADVVPDVVLPVFSVAASKLVFSRGSFDTNIWRIDLDASSTAVRGSSFIASTRNDSWADYCPLGENVAYLSDRSGSQELWLSDRNGANSRQLTTLGGPRLAGPRWAPDGESIAFAAWGDGLADICTVHPADGTPKPITQDPAEDLWPSWSQDSRWIYFGSNRSGDWQIWKAPAEGGAATQVTQLGGHAAMESPDGRVLYFTKGNEVTTLWKMAAGGGQESPVAENVFGPASFYVTAKGVYFLSQPHQGAGVPASARNEHDLRFFRFSTQQTRRVTKVAQPAGAGLAVSRDGRSLLYPRRDQLEADLILSLSSSPPLRALRLILRRGLVSTSNRFRPDKRIENYAVTNCK